MPAVESVAELIDAALEVDAAACGGADPLPPAMTVTADAAAEACVWRVEGAPAIPAIELVCNWNGWA